MELWFRNREKVNKDGVMDIHVGLKKMCVDGEKVIHQHYVCYRISFLWQFYLSGDQRKSPTAPRRASHCAPPDGGHRR